MFPISDGIQPDYIIVNKSKLHWDKNISLQIANQLQKLTASKYHLVYEINHKIQIYKINEIY